MQILSHWCTVGRGSGTNPSWLWCRDAGKPLSQAQPSPFLAARVVGDRVSWELCCGLSVPHWYASLAFTDDLGRCRLSCAVGQTRRMRIPFTAPRRIIIPGCSAKASHTRLAALATV